MICISSVMFGGGQADFEWAEEPSVFLRGPEETSLPIHFSAKYCLRRKAKVALDENQ